MGVELREMVSPGKHSLENTIDSLGLKKQNKPPHDIMKSLFDAETNLEKLFRKVHDKKGWQYSLRSNDQLLLHLLGTEMNIRTIGRVPLPL